MTFSFSKKEFLTLLGILALFLILRLPAVHYPYHQDEYKWPQYANPAITAPGAVPHPPLTEFFYTKFPGGVVGYDNFRFIPLGFEFLTLILLYFFVRKRFSPRIALITSLIFCLSYYSILASLMVDTDGAILPFFFVLCLLFYEYFLQSLQNSGKRKWVWLVVLLISMILGVMVKLSFALAIGAIVLDFLWNHRQSIDRRKIIFAIMSIVGFAVLIYLLLFLSQFIFKGFSLARGETYWDTFVRGFSGRNYFQTGIQFFKALMYSSPFLILFALVSRKFYKKEFLLFQIFIVVGLVFYLVLFDFSIGALDRYFEYLVVPLSVIAASSIDQIFSDDDRPIKKWWLGGGIAAIVLLVLNFLPQHVPPQYPKTAWLHYFASLHWNFLFPFTGGSGPTGFYISWLFIALSWIISLLLIVGLYWKKQYAKGILAVLICIGLAYNLFFTEEYLFGMVNGNVSHLVHDSVAYIAGNPSITNVVVYNDAGGYNVKEVGKYERRMYAAPQFESEYEAYFKNWKGTILYINIPRVDPASFYAQYMNACKTLWQENSGYITAEVLSCNSHGK